jgi:hypothetical protein
MPAPQAAVHAVASPAPTEHAPTAPPVAPIIPQSAPFQMPGPTPREQPRLTIPLSAPISALDRLEAFAPAARQPALVAPASISALPPGNSGNSPLVPIAHATGGGIVQRDDMAHAAPPILPRVRPPDPAPSQTTAPTSVVRVSIGRIELRTAQPAPPVARQRSAPPRPTLSLDDYLKRREGDAR